MHLKEHPDWHDVVSQNRKRTTGYLLAFREPCIQIRDDEIASIRKNRVLVDLDASSILSWTPPVSWLLAVILCPDDDVTLLVEWIQRQGAETERLHFYAHPETDPFEVLRPWAEAGLPPQKAVEGIASWHHLHKRFGLDLSIRILQDWGWPPRSRASEAQMRATARELGIEEASRWTSSSGSRRRGWAIPLGRAVCLTHWHDISPGAGARHLTPAIIRPGASPAPPS